MTAQPDYIQIVISKDEVLNKDLSKTVGILKSLLRDKATIERFHQRVDIGVSGYDEDNRELFEIPEVRNYLQNLDIKFPYWFYFLNNLSRSSLHLITLSCVDCKVENGKTKFDPLLMQDFLNQHFGYMNQIADYVGMSDEDNELLTELILANFS